MTYRDLTGDDVLQAGDVFRSHDIYQPVFHHWIGRKVGAMDCNYKFFRPITLTPAEITAAERAKYESWILSHCSDEYRETYLKESVEPKYEDGESQDEDVQVSWKVWCAAVGCDPMGDV